MAQLNQCQAATRSVVRVECVKRTRFAKLPLIRINCDTSMRDTHTHSNTHITHIHALTLNSGASAFRSPALKAASLNISLRSRARPAIASLSPRSIHNTALIATAY